MSPEESQWIDLDLNHYCPHRIVTVIITDIVNIIVVAIIIAIDRFIVIVSFIVTTIDLISSYCCIKDCLLSTTSSLKV